MPPMEEVLRAMPRLLVLSAPSGYGKSTIALAYASVFKSFAVVDLARSQSARALLISLLKALASEEADQAYIRQAQLSLAADEAVPPQLMERVLDVWRDPGAPAAVVFDNAERLPPDILPLLNEILERRPGQRACIVCSSTPLALAACDVSTSAEAMALNAGDLALSEPEVRDLFADVAVTPEQLRFVIDAARGWPLLAALLKCLCAQGRLPQVMTAAGHGSNREQIYELVHAQVIAALPPELRRIVAFCATVPSVRLEDVQACLGRYAPDALRASVRTFPLIRVEGDRIDVHPLLRTRTAGSDEHAVDDLRLAARAALRRGEPDVAAERYLACGDRHEAAKLLDDILERGATATIAVPALLLDRTILNQHPRWIAITTILRRYDMAPKDHLAVVQAHRRQLKSDDLLAGLALCALETHQLLHCGLREEALERLPELDDFVAQLKRGGIVSALRAHVAARFADTIRAALAVAAGDVPRGERLLKRARFMLGEFPMMTVSAALDGWLPIGLLRGNAGLIAEQCMQARETLRRAGLDVVLLDVDANEAFAGWVLGDDAMYRGSIQRVNERANVYHVRGFEHLLGCAGFGAECEPTGMEPLRRLIIAHLVGAGRTNGERGLRHAQLALSAARELRQPLFVTLAALAIRERGGDPACEPDETWTLPPQVEASLVERMASR